MAPDGNVVLFFKKAIMGGKFNIKLLFLGGAGGRVLGGFWGDWGKAIKRHLKNINCHKFLTRKR